MTVAAFIPPFFQLLWWQNRIDPPPPPLLPLIFSAVFPAVCLFWHTGDIMVIQWWIGLMGGLTPPLLHCKHFFLITIFFCIFTNKFFCNHRLKIPFFFLKFFFYQCTTSGGGDIYHCVACLNILSTKHYNSSSSSYYSHSWIRWQKFSKLFLREQLGTHSAPPIDK